jgi:class 3 adenylate cyclase/predicted ATPase
MRCPNCDAENPAGLKFCEQCAAPFKRRCARCSFENSPTARFCGECAAPLSANTATVSADAPPIPPSPPIRITAERTDAASALEGERKTVTALFADIKGSTELMEDLDPEEARAIIDPALRLMIDAAHRYDGYVVQSTGDGIFALFGAPVAHEDHPQRALYAALRLQEDLERYSAQLREAGNLPIEGRVGVNTGEVVVRTIATGAGQTEYTPIGHTTNLASRMQALAPTGSIAISEQTRKLVEGYFALQPLGPTRVKGLGEPVNVYEVTGLGPLRTRLQRAAGRGLTKFVGRDREIETLRHAADQAKASHGQIVAAMAEAGAGKSRLYFEFKAKNQSGWMVLEAFSISHGKASAYLPVIDLLRNYFGISADDDERKRREKVTGRVVALDRGLEDALPYLFSLLGIVEGVDPLAQMDARIKKSRTLEAIKRIVLRESLNQPLIVIFEDLHWIDEQTQEFLNLLSDSIATAKILLLVNYRPEYSHQWSSKTYYTQLRLDPLGDESANQMLSALLGDSSIPRPDQGEGEHGDQPRAGESDLIALKRLIIERTEGIPFFVEEIVQALFEEGVLQRNGSVKVARSMNAVKVPTTVQAVLAARIDRLPAEAKELLQTLSVIGREFPLSLVRQVVGGAKADDLERMLADLQLGEFIYEQPAVGDTEYLFKHALTQEVAYNSLLIERRKLSHERIGNALEAIFANQLDDHLDELAHHYGRTDNAAKAVDYLGRTGKQALQRSAYTDAIKSLNAAIGLLQNLPDGHERIQRELPLQLALGPASIAVKGWASLETERAYTRARELCERLGDPVDLFPALFGLWIMHLLRGEGQTAFELAEQLPRRAQGVHDQAVLVHAQWAPGVTSYCMGEFISARKHLEMAITLYDSERHRPLAVRYVGIDPRVACLSFVALTLWQLGYPDQALHKAHEVLAFAQRLNDVHNLAVAEFFFGFLRQNRREGRAAQENAESVIALSTEHGLTDWLAWATGLRGWAMAAQGRPEEGITQVQEALAMSRATGAELYRPYYLTLLAEACMETDRLDHALNALTEALAATDKQEIRLYEAETHRLKGEILHRQNLSNAAEARTCFVRAIEIARKQSSKSWELRATTSLARLLDQQGRRDEARTILADIYHWFTEGFDTPDLIDSKALLDQLAE